MSYAYAGIMGAKNTTQREPLDPRQKKNSAGGYAYTVDNWDRLNRFLILGSEGGTYYTTERKLTKQNAAVIQACMKEDYEKAVGEIVAVSDGGRAPKNAPAVFALAVASADPRPEARKFALGALPRVVRIPTDLFQFVAIAEDLRGWGRGLRRAVGNWYNNQTPDHLAYEIAKYQQREGWSNRDLLRLAHPKASSPAINQIFRYIVKGFEYTEVEGLPDLLRAVEVAKKVTKVSEMVKLIHDYRLTREMIPTEMLREKEVWRALLINMPLKAMVRNLGKMTSIGLLDSDLREETKSVVMRLSDAEYIRKSRLHPVALMMASAVYEQGHGDKGKLTWSPVPGVVEALDKAFYLAFQNVEPTKKNLLVALDVSGSMTMGGIGGTRLTPRVAGAALTLILKRTEPFVETVAFSATRPAGSLYSGSYSWETGVTAFPVKSTDTFKDVIGRTSKIPFGGTDCALPMLYAIERKLPVDTFVTITDNESWAGKVHPKEALRQYRDRFNAKAKYIVIAMTATEFTVNDPGDPGGLDVVGFDSNVPAVMAEFIRG